MADTVVIHSFGLNDRSGKVRWLAYELGLSVENVRVELGAHRKFPYRDLNPYAVIPTVQWRDETMIESTAICTFMAEQFPDSKLIVMPGEPTRSQYLQWMSIITDSLETKFVEYYLAGVGLMPAETQVLHEKALKFKLKVLLEQMPNEGFLVADRFTLADITLAYSLRLAISSGLLDLPQVEPYLTPLMNREAAIRAGFFKALE